MPTELKINNLVVEIGQNLSTSVSSINQEKHFISPHEMKNINNHIRYSALYYKQISKRYLNELSNILHLKLLNLLAL